MNSMGRQVSRRLPLQTATRLAALAVALMGLFLMHGLAEHGSAGHGSVPGVGVSPVAAVSGVDVHMAEGLAAAPHDMTVTDPSVTPGGGHGDSELLALCLAIVGTLLTFAAGAMLPWGRLGARALLADQRRVVAWVRARDPAPPDLVRLCIQRC